ncbi:HAMP domain-containing protein [Paenibacillus antri]|uniref:HAMP domain-containing protein n=1 Tax=Paenibacillus antri TaxID=2582848 RepID=A0A5R9GFL9_9BACL|nr:histidine kinase [Paenibacillus antri]TLS53186.1 HAMP domain-containing protein [Paenibacillus antri]
MRRTPHRGEGKFTIFGKLILMFLVVITPLYTLGLLINARGEESVRAEIANSLESRVQFYMNALETEIERMVQLEREYIFDKDLQRLAFAMPIMDEYERTQRIISVGGKLKVIKSSSAYIRSVKAYLPSYRYAITSDDLTTNLIAEEYEAMVASIGRTEGAVYHWNGRYFINRAYPDATQFDPKRSYILSVELSVPALKASLAGFANYEGSGSALLDANGAWFIGGGSGIDVASSLAALRAGGGEDIGVAGSVRSVEAGDRMYLTAARTSELLQATLVVFIPSHEVLGKLDTYRNWFWILSLVSLFVIFLFSFWMYRLIHRPLSRLVRSFRSVEKRRLELIEDTGNKGEFGYLYRQFNAMVNELKVLIHTVYEQKIRAQSSELKQLQSQINPHFLYNSFFILYRLAKLKDLDSVVRFSQYLGEYFQYITRNAARQVKLEAEVNHVKAYVEIQTVRFSERIQAELEPLPQRFASVAVPRLFLQPLVENAYKYGVESKPKGGAIRISFQEEENKLRVVVEDNGPGMTDEALEALRIRLNASGDDVETTGLVNVHRRLCIMYGEGCGLRLSRSDLGGLRVEASLLRSETDEGIDQVMKSQ